MLISIGKYVGVVYQFNEISCVNQYVPAQHNIEQAIANNVEHIEYTVRYINQDGMRMRYNDKNLSTYN